MQEQAALYIRLSKEDGDKESIVNQQLLLRRYAAEHGISVYNEYIDDGYSGTNFERPAFLRMINDMENGFVNLILLKDLSRLGRDYLTAGQYTEVWFPMHGIRCIAVLDGYDSARAAADLVPFRNLINEMYARDISRKIRSALRARMQNGDFIGARAPYGYRKSPADRHCLEPDGERAGVVTRIFREAADGEKPSGIAGRLTAEKIPSPSGGSWTGHGIVRILHNPVYLGDSVQGKSEKLSFRMKSPVRVPAERQVRVEHTHTPLTDRDTFDSAQKYLQLRAARRKAKNRDDCAHAATDIASPQNEDWISGESSDPPRAKTTKTHL